MRTVADGKGGLEGIVVGKTAISVIDGVAGKLSYRGYDIFDLAKHATFEETCYLLWHGELPNREQLKRLDADLRMWRAVPDELLGALRRLARSGPMDALRTAVSALSIYDPEADDASPEANRRKAVRLTAQVATLTAAYGRLRNGQEPVAPDPQLGHAANFLHMLQGKAPDAEVARDFDVCLVLHADHHFNASTFAARVTASTLSDIHSAVTSAIGTLKGPLHGGANEDVMKMLEDVRAKHAEPRAYVVDKLARKEKVPGFGHRIYRTLDPRAVVLKDIAERLGKRRGNLHWYEMQLQIQSVMKEEKNLDANVDFFSASAYNAMGIPRELFTPVFAVARMSGWTAHVLEQQADNRLIRPDAEWAGSPARAWKQIDAR